jgi:hypothetical protein
MNICPAQVIAFVGFRIERLGLPLMDLHKEIHAFILSIAFHPMYDGRKCHMILLEPDPHLFFGLPSGGSQDGFATIQVTGRDTIMPIRIAGIETPQ